MKLIVGLGNSGDKYLLTRHNVGFMVIDQYVGKKEFKYKFNADFIKQGDMIFVKPMTMMNNSGLAVRQIIDYYQIEIADILIIYDDLDLEFATLKLKTNSSSGGHNGIKSIINNLNTQDFLRLKIGINNQYRQSGRDFVVSNFSKSEQKELPEIFLITRKIIQDFINQQTNNELMNKYN